ncbi:MAG TPA: respiratory nitrate reductase subunit gamma [Actinomycetes bacterium]|jgi:nitrate reductase gamma subunit|nr:respiratory nitrate reductase subunit gamma [Actinomycetes bacterium]
MSARDLILWGVLPYVTIAVLVAGTMWRWRYDRFGWTTRSSELYESRLLRIGSPMFHFGLLLVVAGHVLGLVIPESWTEGVGVGERAYHATALTLGGLAGVTTLTGIAILIYRRRRTGPVFMATTRNDKMMYVVLVGAILSGLWVTVVFNGLKSGAAGYDYRATVAPWFRSVFVLVPDVRLMASVPLDYQIHTLVGMALFAIWPFTRLIHAFTVPVHYLFRPYIVYRRRAPAAVPGARPPRPGWERLPR